MLTPLLPRRGRPRAGPAAAPAAVGCVCGHSTVVGRQERHQVVPCSACGRPVFVLPRSPFPPLDPAAPAARAPRPAADREWRFWLGPALAGAVTLAGVGVLLAVLWPLFGRSTRGPAVAASPDPQALERQIHEGRTALNEGAFQVASRLLGEARARAERPDSPLAPERRRQLARWQRQAALLSELLAEPIADVVAHARQLPEREWHELFPARYLGRGVVFDCTVRRDAAGQVAADWEEVAAAEPVRVGFVGLKLLQRLPLAEPQRLLFGARLADVRRGDHGWIVEFVPDSGVLLTEPGVFAGTPLPPDQGLIDVMKRQDGWLEWEIP